MASFRERYGDWALVTGASSGIGREYARQIAAKNVDVILVARRKERLEQLASELTDEHAVRARIIASDLSERSGVETVLRETADTDVGLLVNNAGREDSGHFLESSVDEALNTIDLNCKAPLQLTHHFAKKMKERRKGGILFMSSIVAFQGVPYIANYAATKAYDLVLAESLAAELRQWNIDVGVIAPGFTETELSPDFNFEGLPMKPMPASQVARDAIRSLGRSRLRVPGAMNKFLYASGKYLQTRRMGTYGFGQVFGRVLRSKLNPKDASHHV